MKTLQEKINFVKGLLPNHYTIKESKQQGNIHCKSEIGLRKEPYPNSKGRMIDDDEDEEAWSLFMNSIKTEFSPGFKEVFHNTCFCHVDFTIYIN